MAYIDKYGVEFSDDRKTLIKCPRNFQEEYIIPEGVTSIGDRAFSGCSGLTSVTIPNSVTSIGESAFSGCSDLASISIPNSVTSIKKGIFAGCSGLVNIVVEKGNPSYDSRCCCNSIIETASNKFIAGCKKSNIPNDILSIEDYAFCGCTDLTYITLPDSVTSIGEGVFKACSDLKSIELPGSITDIGDWAFCGCSSLTSIVISNSVTSIGRSAFLGCTSLTSLDIPSSVTSIGSGAFENCSCLTRVQISDIAAWCRIAFDSPDSNPLYYAKHLYQNGSEISDLVIPDSITSIGDYAFYGCLGLQSIIIPNSVQKIGKEAFCNCSNDKAVKLPSKLSHIKLCAFVGCNLLQTINIPKDSACCFCKECLDSPLRGHIQDYKTYKCLGNRLLAIDKNFEGSFIIPNNITSIGDKAFEGCKGVTSVEIPSSVTYIGNRAFMECAGLKSIQIPKGVKYIGNKAFEGCVGLTSIEIPSSVTSIGQLAFYQCSSLTSITIPDSVTYIGECAFSDCSNLKIVIVDNENTKYDSRDNCNAIIETETNALVAGCKSTIIPDSVTSIGEYAFCSCKGLASIIIPNSVKCIGGDAFSECSGLTSITIPHSVTSIGEYAFYFCTGLKSITIPNSVTDIETTSFHFCTNLKEICVPKGQKARLAQMEGLKRYLDLIVERDNEELTILLNIAKGYELGIGMQKSLPQALVTFMQAAEKGCAEAAYHLGEWYEQGEHVPQDLFKAIEYFQQAAKSGFSDAQIRADKDQSIIDEKNAEEARRQEEEQKRIEEERRQEAERKRQEEERQRAEEHRRQEEEKKRKLEEEKRKEEQKRREQHRKEEQRQRDLENTLIGNVLNQHFIKCFYHFTSRKNLASIRKYGGLYSWQYLKNHNVDIPVQGGGELSQGLDRYNGVADYVHLSFCSDHPMAYRHIQNGEDIVVLKISTEVAMLDGTMFSDMNAVDSKAHCAPGLKGLELVDFAATRKVYIKSYDPLFKYKQAEILVKTHVPLKFILNIDDF